MESSLSIFINSVVIHTKTGSHKSIKYKYTMYRDIDCNLCKCVLSRGCLFTELGFRVRISSWILELGFRVRISSWIFELGFRVRISNYALLLAYYTLLLAYYILRLAYYTLLLAYYSLRLAYCALRLACLRLAFNNCNGFCFAKNILTRKSQLENPTRKSNSKS